jgi:DNA-binding transcriptional LysR family regulator
MNFRQLDLNLLRVLAAIHRTGSVTLAGKALSLSQPATSNALARLRHHFSDDLFVRAPAGLRPTRLCEKLAPAVQTQLLQLESLLAGHEPFVPIESDMHWRLSLSDLGETLFLPELASALRRQAPGSQLSNTSVSADQVAAALEAREIDLALGFLQPRHKGVRSESLFSGTYVAISSPEWRPASGRIGATLTRRQMADAAYVVAAPTATLHSGVAMVLARSSSIASCCGHAILARCRNWRWAPICCRSCRRCMHASSASVMASVSGELRARHLTRCVWSGTVVPTVIPRTNGCVIWCANFFVHLPGGRCDSGGSSCHT